YGRSGCSIQNQSVINNQGHPARRRSKALVYLGIWSYQGRVFCFLLSLIAALLGRVPTPNFFLQLTFGHGSDLEQCPVFNLQLLGVMELAVFPPRMGQVEHDASTMFVILAQDPPPGYPLPLLYPPVVDFFVF